MKETNQEKTIYVLSYGAYSRRRIVAVTEDAKAAAKAYAEGCEQNESPLAEIWRGNAYIDGFDGFEKNADKVKAALTKRAMGIE